MSLHDGIQGYIDAHLNREYVERLGRETAASLHEGLSVSVPYQPGNGTRYELVLTPMFNVVEPPSPHPVATDSPRESSVCIAIVNDTYHVAYVLPILQQGFWHHESFLMEKLNISKDDALALLALFTEISK